MKKYTYLLLFFLVLPLFGQEKRPLQLKSEQSVVHFTPPTPQQKSRSAKQEKTLTVGRTASELAVSSTGAATYLVPFVLPPGIKEVVPSLALSYNSQGGNGITGWGWNIAGLSTISRIGSTQLHDRHIDPVDFDEHDRFALDGQRLILIGGEEYGADKTVYTTENYSNLKIVASSSKNSEGVWTPANFTVYYPDGARAFYSTYGGLEWAISRWVDPQGNSILYTYHFDGGTLAIDTIYYGARSNNKADHPNVISFNYKTKNQYAKTYVGGLPYYQPKILDAINITTKGSVYRHYQLSHDLNTTGYERLTSVEEQTASEKKPPVTFQYTNEDYEIITAEINLDHQGIFNFDNFDFDFNFPDIDLSQFYNAFLNGTLNDPNNLTSNSLPFTFDPLKHQLIPGDYNGDGEMDFVLKNGLNYSVFHSNGNGGLSLYLGEENELESEKPINQFLPATFQTAQGKIKGQQGFISVDQTFIDQNYNTLTGGIGPYEEMRFTTHVMKENGSDVSSYEKRWHNYDHLNQYSTCGQSTIKKTIPKLHFPVDFDGDGRTDLLMLEKPYTYLDCTDSFSCDCSTVLQNTLKVFLVDMDRNKTEDFVFPLGSLFVGNEDRIELADFDDDGLPELWRISEGKVQVYTFFNKELQLLIAYEHSSIDLENATFLGDYNGDGKTDLLLPKAKNSNDWQLFYSTGKGFKRNSLFNTPIVYEASRAEDKNRWYDLFPSPSNVVLHENFYIPQDVNGDGLSDLVVHKREQENANLKIYLNQSDATGQQRFALVHSSDYSVGVLNRQKSGTSFGVDRNVATQQNTFYYIIGQSIFKRSFDLSNQDETLLRKVSHKGLVQDIYYQPLHRTGNGFYQNDESQIYPYVNINTALSIALVEQVVATANGVQVIQKFDYHGAVSHAGGLGFLGFLGTARTNSFGTNVRGLWQISQHDPQKRGAVTQSWIGLTKGFSPPAAFQQKTTYEYSTSTTDKGVFINVPSSILTQDGLMGFETLQTYTYDAYYNPSRILTERFSGTTRQGSSDQHYSYHNTPSATDATYHIGRLTEEISTETWGNRSHTTTTQYTDYDNNLITKMKLQGDDTKWLTEKMDYDAFGNLLSKKLSAQGESDRKQSYTYSTDGRFLESATDLEGLTSRFSYYANGTLEKETDPFNKTTTYGYDGWQRTLSVIDYLGNANHLRYTWQDNNLVETQSGADGSQSKRYIDPWGRSIHEGSLALSGKWRWQTTRYDVAGRIQRQSEPYFAATPNQGSLFTHFSYDAYGRILIQAQPTGKNITTTYTDGSPTTVVNDGYQEVQTTLDARGKIAQLTDPNGTIVYTYHPTGELLESNYDGHVVKVSYDGWGRKKSLSDPSAGEFSYTYDIFGQLTQEVSPWGTTDYTYDAQGKLKNKTQKGDNTHLDTDYSYDATTKLLTREDTTDRWNGDSFVKTIAYDEHERPKNLTESNDWASFSQSLSYDTLGRIAQEQRNATATGAAQRSVAVTHRYAANGQLDALLANQKKVWELKAENARGQATQVGLGNGITKNNTIDALGFLEDTTHGSVFSLDLNYNKKKGVLNSRKQQGHEKEVFTHDSRNRLTQIRQGTSLRKYEYDELGRMTDNKDVGEHLYTNVEDRYLIDSTYINAHGLKFYKTYYHQIVEYNIDRKAVSVHQVDIGRVDFVYNASGDRVHGFYGNEEEAWVDRKYRKHYSTLFPAEIKVNQETGESQTLFYLGGDGYTAPVALINGEDHYLHRDHLGSVLAISDSNGSVVEERHFDAWGQNITLKQNGIVQEDFNESLLLRGFTGHEHFTEVDLIHMNGRMFSPRLKRFLSPDNHVTDPYDTRSYDRKAYVWNNPLMATDPSGEAPIFAAVWAVVKTVGAIMGVHQVLRTIGAYSTGYYTGWRPLAATFLQVGLAALNLGQAIGTSLFSSTTLTIGQQMAGAAIAGFISGTLGTVVAGASIGDALKGGVASAGIAAAMVGLEGLANAPGPAVEADGGTDKGKSDTAKAKGNGKLNGAKKDASSVANVDVGEGYFVGLDNHPNYILDYYEEIVNFYRSHARAAAQITNGMNFDSPFFVPSLVFGTLSLGPRAVRGVSVIGPRATYRQFGNKIGANYLNVTDEAWTMQKNMDFLRGVVKRGDNVIFAGKFNPAKINSTSVLAKEINYLQRHGYKWTDNYSKLIKQ